MIEREVKSNTDIYVPKREDFGTSRMAEVAYSTILQGATCQEILEEVTGENGRKIPIKICDERGIKSVHFDVSGHEDFIIACSGHVKKIAGRIEDDLKKQGRVTVISVNGWGRE